MLFLTSVLSAFVFVSLFSLILEMSPYKTNFLFNKFGLNSWIKSLRLRQQLEGFCDAQWLVEKYTALNDVYMLSDLTEEIYFQLSMCFLGHDSDLINSRIRPQTFESFSFQTWYQYCWMSCQPHYSRGFWYFSWFMFAQMSLKLPSSYGFNIASFMVVTYD